MLISDNSNAKKKEYEKMMYSYTVSLWLVSVKLAYTRI